MSISIEEKNMLPSLAREVARRLFPIIPINRENKSVQDIYESCKKGKFRVLGEGRTRATFDIGGLKVAKILKRKRVSMEHDVYQTLNENEMNFYKSYGNIIPMAKCFDFDKATQTLIMERTVPFIDFVRSFVKICPIEAGKLNIRKEDAFLEEIEEVATHPGLARLLGISPSILEYICRYTPIRYSELTPVFNWGVNQDGRLVCIDYSETLSMYWDSCSSENSDFYCDSLSDLSYDENIEFDVSDINFYCESEIEDDSPLRSESTSSQYYSYMEW